MLLVVLLVSPMISQVFAATEWYVNRPYASIVYHQTVSNGYTNGIASCGMGVEIIQYVEDNLDFGGKDTLSFRVVSCANTRAGIKYTVQSTGLTFWYGSSTSTGITQDDQSKQFNLPFGFRYYGIVYNKVWVCSNGFLSFDSSSTSCSPQSIPNSATPNTLIAGFWRDLNPAKGGSITYFSGLDSSNLYVFAVTWNAVPNYANSNTQTFQIILRQNRWNYEDDIFFEYEYITKDVSTVVGIEDQTGLKGTSYSSGSLGNFAGVIFQCGMLPRTIDYLTIKAQKFPSSGDYEAAINVQNSEIGGYNVRLHDTSNPWATAANDIFVTGLKAALPIMATAIVGVPVAGQIVGGVLLTVEIATILSRALSPTLPTGKQDCGYSDILAYVKVPGSLEDPNEYAVYDATLGSTFIWVFSDLGDISHTLQIWTELEYYDWAGGVVTISSQPVYISVLHHPTGGGGGCPELYAWNGEKSVDEGLINIHSTADITVQTPIPKEDLVPEHNEYLVSLKELDNYTSHIDYIKLYALDPGGRLFEFPLVSAVHSTLGNVKSMLLYDDNVKVDLQPSETIEAEFAARHMDKIAYFIFEINGVNYK